MNQTLVIFLVITCFFVNCDVCTSSFEVNRPRFYNDIKKHFAEDGFLLKDAMTTGISPQYENTKNKSNTSKNVKENTNADYAGTNVENVTQETSDIESTLKYSKKVANKKRKKSKRKKNF